MSWLSRSFFVVVALLAVAGLWGTQGCTRRGGNGSSTPPTAAPQTTFVVDPVKGNDSTGNGTAAKPYKTITKALTVIAKDVNTGLTIALDKGTYSASSGEKFPLVVPTGVTIAGVATGSKRSTTISFVSGYGEDKLLETAVGAASGTLFATMVVPGTVTGVTLQNLSVGAKHVTTTPTQHYASFDLLGGLNVSHASFGASLTPRLVDGGIIVASGSLTCSACAIYGSRYAIEAFSVPSASGPPSIILNGQFTQSIIGGQTGILTDGTASVNAENQTFNSTMYAYRDTLTPPTSLPSSPSPSPTTSPTTAPSSSPTSTFAPPTRIDFGSPGGSGGQNQFRAASISEIDVTQPDQEIDALGNAWQITQGVKDKSGLYRRMRIFHTGDHGLNVTITGGASSVTVGPLPVPTPTPPPSSPSPSTSPRPT